MEKEIRMQYPKGDNKNFDGKEHVIVPLKLKELELNGQKLYFLQYRDNSLNKSMNTLLKKEDNRFIKIPLFPNEYNNLKFLTLTSLFHIKGNTIDVSNLPYFIDCEELTHLDSIFDNKKLEPIQQLNRRIVYYNSDNGKYYDNIEGMGNPIIGAPECFGEKINNVIYRNGNIETSIYSVLKAKTSKIDLGGPKNPSEPPLPPKQPTPPGPSTPVDLMDSNNAQRENLYRNIFDGKFYLNDICTVPYYGNGINQDWKFIYVNTLTYEPTPIDFIYEMNNEYYEDILCTKKINLNEKKYQMFDNGFLLIDSKPYVVASNIHFSLKNNYLSEHNIKDIVMSFDKNKIFYQKNMCFYSDPDCKNLVTTDGNEMLNYYNNGCLRVIVEDSSQIKFGDTIYHRTEMANSKLHILQNSDLLINDMNSNKKK